MTTQLEAIYEAGVLRPLGPLTLQEHQRVTVTISESLSTDAAHFVLDSERWEQFREALDSPPKTIPALRKLLNEPSVLEYTGESSN